MAKISERATFGCIVPQTAATSCGGSHRMRKEKVGRMTETREATRQARLRITTIDGAEGDQIMRVLVLGSRIEAAPPQIGAPRPALAGFHFAAVADLSPSLLAALRPDLILSPLLAGSHDVIDVARRLAELGYAGRYRALADHLPDPAIILTEVRLIAPALDFDLFLVNASLTSPSRKAE